MRKNKQFPLSDSHDGDNVEVVDTGAEEITVQALRFGLDAGSLMQVVKNIRGGPVIIARNHLELAIGREIAKNIKVTLVEDDATWPLR